MLLLLLFFFNSPWAQQVCLNISRQANVLSLSWASGEVDWQTVTRCDSSQHLDGLAAHAALFTWAGSLYHKDTQRVCSPAPQTGKRYDGKLTGSKFRSGGLLFVLPCLSTGRARFSCRISYSKLKISRFSAIVTMQTGQLSLDQWYLYKTGVLNNSLNFIQWLGCIPNKVKISILVKVSVQN